MSRIADWRAWIAVLLIVAATGPTALGQQDQPAASEPAYRTLAPGVLQSVDPVRQVGEAFSRHDIVELLAAEPADAPFDWARGVDFCYDVWTLELRFKPVRMIQVDVPQPDGAMKSKLIWYLVYSVTNKRVEEKTVGLDVLSDESAESLPKFGWMHPVRAANGKYQFAFINKPIRFVPQFLLEGHESLQEDRGFNKVYLDRVIPVALRRIAQREDPNRQFFSSVDISQGAIAVGKTAWGVATWEDVDSRIDRFSVYVKGLTNAYKWTDDPGNYQKDAPLDSYRRLMVKTLKLNFWRPGDELREHEGEIHYGIPGGVDYEWVYLVETGIEP
jgi:hypothetical protein